MQEDFSRKKTPLRIIAGDYSAVLISWELEEDSGTLFLLCIPGAA